MRRPPALLAAAALAFVLWACEKPGTEQQSKDTDVALVPFDTASSDEVDETSPPETDPPPTEATDENTDEETDADSSDDETDETDPPDTTDEQAIDPMPGDTAVFDTLGIDDPLCAAAQQIVDLNDQYQKDLAKALEAGGDDALVKALRKLPVEDMRDAYDDLSAELPKSLRRKVALIRDFTVEHGEEIRAAEDLQSLSQLIADIEGDPDVSKVTKATKDVSAYTEDKCGVRIAQG